MTMHVKGATSLATQANSVPRLTGELWRDFDFDLATSSPYYGWYSLDSWKQGPKAIAATSVVSAPYATTIATAGTTAQIAGPSGFGALWEVDSASSTSTQGMNVQFVGEGAYLGTGQTMYFECMLRAHDIATGPEFFLGVSGINTAIITSSAVPGTTNHWQGFYIIDDGVGVSWAARNGSSTTTYASDVHAFIDADVTSDGTEWVRLGFRWVKGVSCDIFVNDTKTSVGVTTEPAAFVCPSVVCQSSGTTAPLLRFAHTAWAVKN